MDRPYKSSLAPMPSRHITDALRVAKRQRHKNGAADFNKEQQHVLHARRRAAEVTRLFAAPLRTDRVDSEIGSRFRPP